MKRALLLSVWALAASAETLIARDAINVSGRTVSLAQLVDGSIPGELRARLAARTVVDRLRIDEPRRLGRSQIQAAWRQTLGADAERWSLQVGDQVVVTRQGGDSADNRLVETGAQALRTKLAKECAQLELHPVADTFKLRLPDGDLRLSARSSAISGVARRMSAWVDVFEHGEFYGSWPMWFEVACFRTGYRASRSISRGEVLSAANMTETILEVERGQPLRMPVGKVASRDLAEGALLEEADATPAPLVRKGSSVRVRLRSGGVQMELDAVALNDGVAGQVVYVRRGADQPAIQVRVIADGVVDVL